MGSWQLLLMGLVVVFGLLGAVLPGVPGPAVVWAAVFWWASAEDSSRGWWVLVSATAILLLNQAVQWLLPVRNRRVLRFRRRQLLVAGGTGTAGFFLLPVVGVVPGFLAGLYGWERRRLGSHGAALSSTGAIMRAVGRNILVELTACLLVTALWLTALIWASPT